MAINSVTLTGRLTRPADYKVAANGTDILTFSIANNEHQKRNGEWQDYPNYFDCTLFGARAEKLQTMLGKGSQVGVKGHLRQDRWQDQDGKTRSRVVVIVEDLELLGSKPKNEDAEEDGSLYDEDVPF